MFSLRAVGVGIALSWLMMSMCGCGAAQGAPDSGGGKTTPEKGKKKAPVPVVVAPVVVGAFPRTMTGIGHLVASSTIVVRPQVTGILQTVGFEEGTVVTAGQLLFTIDDRLPQAALHQAKAVAERSRTALPQSEAILRRDEALRANAEVQNQRYLALQGQRIISDYAAAELATNVMSLQATVLADKAAILTAQASIAIDEAAVISAATALEYYHISAPITGRVGLVGATVGNLVTANQTTLVTITQTQPMHALWTLPEDALRAIWTSQVKQHLQVTIGPIRSEEKVGSWTSQGTLDLIDQAVDPATSSIRLRATVNNGDGQLWPGQPVQARLVLGIDDQALTVPDGAVQFGQRGAYVYVITTEKIAEIRQVEIVRAEGGRTMLAKGVAAGEQVVIDGQVRLSPGALVTLAMNAAAPGKNGSATPDQDRKSVLGSEKPSVVPTP